MINFSLTPHRHRYRSIIRSYFCYRRKWNYFFKDLFNKIFALIEDATHPLITDEYAGSTPRTVIIIIMFSITFGLSVFVFFWYLLRSYYTSLNSPFISIDFHPDVCDYVPKVM